MSDLAELKKLIEQDGKLTAELQKKFATLSDDAVSKDEYKKLETAVAEAAKDRAAMEARHQAELKSTTALIEELSIKVGRRGLNGDDDPKAALRAEHKTAFVDWLRAGRDGMKVSALSAVEKKAVDTLSGSSGGFAVPQDLAREIVTKATDESMLRPRVQTITVGTSDYRRLIDKGGLGYGWVGEGDARAETGTPTVYEVRPPMGTLYAYPKATEESLDDMFIDIEGWLTGQVAIQFANAEDTAIIAGDGINKPLGLLYTAPVADADGARADQVLQYLPTGVADDWGAVPHANLIDMIYGLRARYRRSAAWYMNSLTTAKIRVLQDSDGRPLWTDNLAPGQPATLLGYPVVETEGMPDFAANAHPIMFGALAETYVLVDRHGLRITTDEVTEPGYRKWHVRRRIGGAVTNDDATKVLKIAAA